MNLYKFNFKKALGQNFLVDENIVNKIVESADLNKDTLVIEVGPGAGALSKKMAVLCGNLLCYEIDNSLMGILDQELGSFDNVLIKYEDFLTADVISDIKGYSYERVVVVSNLPYYITTAIINKLIMSDIMPSLMILMVQKEVADRFCAVPKTRDYNSLSLFLQYHYDIKSLFVVSKNCFIPKPKIDSCVVRFEAKKDKLYVENLDKFYQLIKDSFKFKRKNLRNNLKSYDLNKISAVLSKYGLDLTARGEEISLDIFVDIANSI